jgi:hypothetical protein
MNFHIVEPPFDPASMHCCNKDLLKEEMLGKSRASSWDEARLEWSFHEAYMNATPTHCLCGHGILERCVLHNASTNCFVLVGSRCVREFMHELCQVVPVGAIFASIRRVRADPSKSFHGHLVKWAHAKRHISDRALAWYNDNRRNRKLSHGELKYRETLNRRIMNADDEFGSPKTPSA